MFIFDTVECNLDSSLNRSKSELRDNRSVISVGIEIQKSLNWKVKVNATVTLSSVMVCLTFYPEMDFE